MQDIKFLLPIVSNSKLKQMIADLQERIEENLAELPLDSDYLDDIRSDYHISTEDWMDKETSDGEYYSELGGYLVRSESAVEQESDDGIYSDFRYSSSGLHPLDCQSHY